MAYHYFSTTRHKLILSAPRDRETTAALLRQARKYRRRAGLRRSWGKTVEMAYAWAADEFENAETGLDALRWGHIAAQLADAARFDLGA